MTRAEARALGLKRYSTGVACRHGHGCDRFTSSNRCRVCHRLREHNTRASRAAWMRLYRGRTGKTRWGRKVQEVTAAPMSWFLLLPVLGED